MPTPTLTPAPASEQEALREPPAPSPHDLAAGAHERRRNHRLGVLNGAFYQMGEGLVDSTTVIPVFVSRLTTSSAMVGLCSALSEVGWFLPQFAVAPWVARYPRLMWLYRRVAVARAVALGLLAALIMPLVSGNPDVLLGVFLVCYGTYALGAGIAAIPFVEVVSKTVPRERLGAYWSQRLFWGGLLAAGAALLIRESSRIGDLGVRYALLFAGATVLVSIGYAAFSVIREPAGAVGDAAATPARHLRDGWRMLHRDPPFRRLFVARATLSLWLTASPFMVLFAVNDLGGGAPATGTFLFARVTGFVVSNLAWQPLSHRYGNRALMRLAALGCGAATLAAAAIAAASPWWLHWLSPAHAVTALEVVAGAGGAVHSAMIVGYASLLIELAPHGRRHSFVSLMNSFLGVTMLLPAFGGALVDWINAPVVFALCALLSVFGYRAACRLPGRAEMAARALPPAEATAPTPGGVAP